MWISDTDLREKTAATWELALENIVVRDEFRPPTGEGDGFEVGLEELEVTGQRPSDLSCIGCDEPVLLRSGDKNRPHFAHRAGSGCSAGESALHRAAILVLSEGIVGAAQAGREFPMPISCSFCDVNRQGNLARDRGLMVTVDRQLSNGIRPDLLIASDEGKPRYIIEVVVTHAPEEAATSPFSSGQSAIASEPSSMASVSRYGEATDPQSR